MSDADDWIAALLEAQRTAALIRDGA